MLPHRRWRDMTVEDFSGVDTSSWIAVLPVAAIEQHGPHLPLSTDTAIAEGMIAKSIELMPNDLPAIVLPVQQIGKSNEHIASPGTLSHGWDTLVRMLIELGESVHRAGISKLVLINSHGGNVPVLDIVARELRVTHRMLVVATGWGRLGEPDGVIDQAQAAYGIHGDERETSIMLHLAPELVHMDKALDFRTRQIDDIERFNHLRTHGRVQYGWLAQDLHPSGAAGNAANATAEKGAALIAYQANAFVELLNDIKGFNLSELADAPTR